MSSLCIPKLPIAFVQSLVCALAQWKGTFLCVSVLEGVWNTYLFMLLLLGLSFPSCSLKLVSSHPSTHLVFVVTLMSHFSLTCSTLHII